MKLATAPQATQVWRNKEKKTIASPPTATLCHIVATETIFLPNRLEEKNST